MRGGGGHVIKSISLYLFQLGRNKVANTKTLPSKFNWEIVEAILRFVEAILWSNSLLCHSQLELRLSWAVTISPLI